MKKIVQIKYLFALLLGMFVIPLFAQEQPDLTSTVMSNIEYVSAGDTMAVNSRVNNIGNYAVDESYVHLYLSTDDVYDIADTFLDSLRYGRIVGKRDKVTAIDLVIPGATSSGDYYIVAYVDKLALVAETNETNNESSMAITVSSIDLTAINLSATPNPVSVLQQITFEFDIKNLSGSFVPPSDYKIYLSEDTIINSGDTYLTTGYDIENASGSTVSVSRSLNIGDCLSSGDYYLLISVDDNSEVLESDEDNNIIYHEIAIIQANTDLTIYYNTGSIENSTFLEGDNISFNGFRIRSAGKIPAPSSDIKIYWSWDEILDANDALVYSETGDTLTCGSARNASGSITITDTVSYGQKYLIAVADPDANVAEDDETNNTDVISFWVAQSINLSISGCSITPTLFDGNDNFIVNCTIQNNGATPLGEVSVYLESVQDGTTTATQYVFSTNSMNSGEQEIISETISAASIFGSTNEYVDVLSTNNTNFILKTYVGGQSGSQSECSTAISVSLDVDYYIDDVTTNKDEYAPGEDMRVDVDVLLTFNLDFVSSS